MIVYFLHFSTHFKVHRSGACREGPRYKTWSTCSIVLKCNVQVAMSFEVLMTCKISWTKQMGFPYKTNHNESVFILSRTICLFIIVITTKISPQCAWHFPYSFHLGIIHQICFISFQWMFWASHKCPRGVWHVC